MSDRWPSRRVPECRAGSVSLPARRGALGLAAGGALAAFAPALRSQGSYPSGPVRIIVPYGPGAATDAIARLVAGELQAALGGTFVVDNKPGAGSQIGTRMVAEAAPDGQTLGFIDTAFVINPALLPKLPYDTRRDFLPLSLAATAQLVLLIHQSVAATDMAGFLSLARAEPGRLNFSSAGVGSAPHLAGEQFRVAAGIRVNHVPYKGGSAVFSDLLAGHVQFGFTTVPSMVEHVRAGRVRALAVTGEQRSPLLPDVPTMAEVGLPAVDAMPLFGLVAPAGLPPAIASRIADVAARSVREGAASRTLASRGFTPVGNTPDQFRQRVDGEIAKWSAVIKAAGIQVE